MSEIDKILEDWVLSSNGDYFKVIAEPVHNAQPEGSGIPEDDLDKRYAILIATPREDFMIEVYQGRLLPERAIKFMEEIE